MFFRKKRRNKIKEIEEIIRSRFEQTVYVPVRFKENGRLQGWERMSIKDAVQELIDATGLSKEFNPRPRYRLSITTDSSDESPSK